MWVFVRRMKICPRKTSLELRIMRKLAYLKMMISKN